MMIQFEVSKRVEGQGIALANAMNAWNRSICHDKIWTKETVIMAFGCLLEEQLKLYQEYMFS